MDSSLISDCPFRNFYIYLYQKGKAWILDSRYIISPDYWDSYPCCREKLSNILGRVSSYNEAQETICLGTGYKARRIYGGFL